jgi:nucleoside-diphosphate-sugar epimerase
MKVLVAGSTGALGRRLVPILVQAGHQVVGMTRTRGKMDALRAAGAEPVIADALDAAAVGVHVDDAAQATLAAIEGGEPGLYNVADDEPAQVAEWLPVLAEAIGARPPRHVPRFLARLLMGEHTAVMMTGVRGASNAKAKRELHWRPRWSSWRDGFRHGLSDRAIGREYPD